MLNDSPQSLIDKLHTDLQEARKAQDRLTSTTLQAVISAIDNAGTVPVPKNINTIGVGATEALRQELSLKDVQEIIAREVAELQHAIKELGSTQGSYIDELNSKIVILEKYL